MNADIHLEHRADSSRSKHEGEPSFALCDRLNRTRDNSQRQLPTDHDYAVPTREYQTDQSSLKPARLLLALSSRRNKGKRQLQKQSHYLAALTRSLHIRAMRSSNFVPGNAVRSRTYSIENTSYDLEITPRSPESGDFHLYCQIAENVQRRANPSLERRFSAWS